ncbi:hypothetical protein RJ639_028637 [Escallonia herrerae]|uniref:Transposase (putative) gypsy type domain-containing protein n=1 Tax=Escallonia herrerae TaxID=1293975 RepID=A0AA89BHF2_9ASTE|nr:hypothetical protein RJ639_028637 [Escallonia herrerae]
MKSQTSIHETTHSYIVRLTDFKANRVNAVVKIVLLLYDFHYFRRCDKEFAETEKRTTYQWVSYDLQLSTNFDQIIWITVREGGGGIKGGANSSNKQTKREKGGLEVDDAGKSQVGTSIPQASTLFPLRDALGEIKDEAKDKFNEDTWFSADEKRNKMTKESIVELSKELPLLPPFSARVPTLQEPTNYGTDLETSVYEGQIKSGYRVLMHPFVVAFFNHYKMAPGQLVPNGWRKLVGLIYLVQTSGYPVSIHDFMRLYLEVCFIKNVASSVGWYYIHNRVRMIKGVLNPTKAGTPGISSFSGQAANGSSQESGTVSVKIMKRKASWLLTLPPKKLLIT